MNNRIRNNNSRKRAVKRERIIMIVTSAFVMAALTMTGVYMKEKTEQEQDNGYSVDLAQLESNVEDKYQELAEGIDNNIAISEQELITDDETDLLADHSVIEDSHVLDEELDYMPREDSVIDVDPIAAVDSGHVEIPGLTDVQETEIMENEEPTIMELYFTEEEGLIAPVSGEILMHYNMDSTVYFATLDQYKYNPAVIFQADEGSHVVACADGQVVKIYQNEEIGTALVLDLGNGYEVTYGQLATYTSGLGDYVTAGQVIGTVARPTKYYVVEGNNLYFSMEKDGEVINPEELLP